MMLYPRPTGDLIAHIDQASAELSAWAALLCGYRSALVEGGFSEDAASRLCEISLSELLCHALSESEPEKPSRGASGQ